MKTTKEFRAALLVLGVGIVIFAAYYAWTWALSASAKEVLKRKARSTSVAIECAFRSFECWRSPCVKHVVLEPDYHCSDDLRDLCFAGPDIIGYECRPRQ